MRWALKVQKQRSKLIFSFCLLRIQKLLFGARPKYMSPLRPYCASNTGLTYSGGVASSIPQRSYVLSHSYPRVWLHFNVSYDWVGNGRVAYKRAASTLGQALTELFHPLANSASDRRSCDTERAFSAGQWATVQFRSALIIRTA